MIAYGRRRLHYDDQSVSRGPHLLCFGGEGFLRQAGVGAQPDQLSPDIGGAAADEFLVERDGSHVRIIACAPSLTARRGGITPPRPPPGAPRTLQRKSPDPPPAVSGGDGMSSRTRPSQAVPVSGARSLPRSRRPHAPS